MKIPSSSPWLAVFGLLRFRRANLLTWAGCLVGGDLRPPPIRIHGPDSRLRRLALHGNRLDRDPGVRVLQPGAPRRSLPPARPVHDGEAVHALLGATVVAIPALAAANVYVQMNVPLEPPLFSRTVHPASPSEITVHDKKIDLDAGENPFRHLETSNPEEFRKHVENGRQVYYRNCVFCHGDNMAGNGMFVHGLDPIPTNFTDPGTIAMLRETFLFWRISKGGPGLPEEGGPWDTAMPAWEKFLKEEEMWDAILFLYDFTGQRPRAREEAAHEMTSRLSPRVRAAPSTLAVRARRWLAVLIVADGVVGADGDRCARRRPDVGTEAQRESGKKLYLKNCSQCHGEKGDGEGYAAPHLRPRPRNFTTGKFKIRTTPNGALPTHQDLVNIIRRGMPYTSMPAWPNSLRPGSVGSRATSLRPSPPTSRTPRMSPKPVRLPSAPRATNESIELGKKLYEETGCVKCHGTLGRGDGPSAPTLKDDWGHPIRAADLAQSWTFRGGSSREDIFRTMSTGFNGTPMPSFLEALKPEQRWAITDFIVSLSGSNGPGYSNLVVAKHVQDPIDLAKGAASFASAPVARFPIVGQIMEPGRAFHPPATSVTVQAIYDADSIALLVRWHDMSAQKTGKNGPSLPVPPEEEEERSDAAGEGAAAARRGASLARKKSPRHRPGRRRTPLPRPEAAPAAPAIRVLRRRLDPDSFAGADGRPQALLHLRRRPELGGSLVLRSGPSRSPSVHRQGKRGHRSQRHGRSHRCRELRPGRMVGHLQAAPSASLGRPVLARRVHADRLLGLGRVLARAWQQARSHGLVLPLRRARSGPLGRRPDGEDGARSSSPSSSP